MKTGLGYVISNIHCSEDVTGVKSTECMHFVRIPTLFLYVQDISLECPRSYKKANLKTAIFLPSMLLLQRKPGVGHLVSTTTKELFTEYILRLQLKLLTFGK